eukprot:TRINITY_DN3050_c0_g1_i1.p1 TRINITY_DN3050_c0_g1~~TRINITY_DN3050_c0_g1_i1.p1  ORF type:complete len:553 (+),score=210.21 TRINITY_DN3050_c0_g1_i1:109-1659(+)
MVVLASAITTKNGKALLSRQFVELSKARIEGLLAAFPKLMSSEKQHTFVETDSVRYVYQPMEGLYMLLITNKTSNILADLETLHLLAKIVPEYCQILEEKEILRKAFEIVFAFDEAIAMGYKEKVNLQQIKHFTTMESLDEERHKIEEQNKMMLAKKEMERQRKQIERKRLESKMTGFGSEGGGYSGGMGGGGRGDSGMGGRSSPALASREPVVVESRSSPKPESSSAPGRGGMKLGSKGGAKPSLLSQVLKEENVFDEPPSRGSPAASSQASAPVSSAKVQITLSEKIAMVAKNDGGLDSLEVKGELSVQVNDPNLARLKLHISQGDNRDFQFKTHPNMNKNAWNDNVLALKNPEKGYPVGVPTSVLKWRYFTTDEDRIPFAISVWPSTSAGETTVPIEFEKKCDFDLADVTVSIPIPGSGAPVIGDAVGSCEFNSKSRVLNWNLPLIDDGNANGSMEFTVPSAPNSAFFPVVVDFHSNSTFAALQIVEAVLDDTGKSIDFASETSLTVEQYEIQ